jgi:hypothetical protein
MCEPKRGWVSDHVWVVFGKTFQDANVRYGERIVLSAKVTEYPHASGDPQYGLAKPLFIERCKGGPKK